MFEIRLNILLEYTEWERQKWHEWLRQRGDEVLGTSVGPNGDGRFGTVGELVRHIFSSETRYADRLLGRPLTDASYIPAGDIEAIFRFGEQSRRNLKELIATFPAQEWDVPMELRFPGLGRISASPGKIVVHVLLHEIRHWAQIATLLRLNGHAAEMHDFLVSPAMGGEFRRDPALA